MVDSTYSWPRYPTGPEEHLKALGVISLNFNLYEFSLVTFLEQHFDKDVANLLFDKLNSEERAALIRTLFKSDPEPAVVDEIEYCLRHFATCAVNRHNLIHSRLVMPHTNILALEKFARGKPDEILQFQLDVGDLRRAADEMNAGFEFVLKLWHYFEDRFRYHERLEMAEEGLIEPSQISPEPPALPKRPPAPRQINPHR